jgi:hypothetical protein
VVLVVLFYLNDPVIVIDGYQMSKSKKEKRPPRDHPEIVIEEERLWIKRERNVAKNCINCKTELVDFA